MAERIRVMDLPNLMRHAFLAGRGLNMGGDVVSAEDRSAWVDYDPSDYGPYQRLSAYLMGYEPVQELTAGHKNAANEGMVVREILLELERARTKFPGPDATLAALVEEVGEVAKALMDESRERVRKEAVQVAVMAIRLILDGDATLDEFRRSKGLDPLIGP